MSRRRRGGGEDRCPPRYPAFSGAVIGSYGRRTYDSYTAIWGLFLYQMGWGGLSRLLHVGSLGLSMNSVIFSMKGWMNLLKIKRLKNNNQLTNRYVYVLVDERGETISCDSATVAESLNHSTVHRHRTPGTRITILEIYICLRLPSLRHWASLCSAGSQIPKVISTDSIFGVCRLRREYTGAGIPQTVSPIACASDMRQKEIVFLPLMYACL